MSLFQQPASASNPALEICGRRLQTLAGVVDEAIVIVTQHSLALIAHKIEPR
jgi:hypothetical protein